MLVLTRKASQQVMIGTEIRITVVRTDRNRVRLGIEAPGAMTILRGELTPTATAHGRQASHPAAPTRGQKGPRPRD